MMLIQAKNLEDVDEILLREPFLTEKYYESYELKEFMEAIKQNNWLMDSPQTEDNLKE